MVLPYGNEESEKNEVVQAKTKDKLIVDEDAAMSLNSDDLDRSLKKDDLPSTKNLSHDEILELKKC